MAASLLLIELLPGGPAMIEAALRHRCTGRLWCSGDVLVSLSGGVTLIEAG